MLRLSRNRLVLIMLLPGILCLLVCFEYGKIFILNKIPSLDHGYQISNVIKKMTAVQNAAETFKLVSPDHSFPDSLNVKFSREISKAAVKELGMPEHDFDSASEWLIVHKIRTANDCLAQVDVSSHNHVFYCPIENNHHAVGYRILGVDYSGRLITCYGGKTLLLRDAGPPWKPSTPQLTVGQMEELIRQSDERLPQPLHRAVTTEGTKSR